MLVLEKKEYDLNTLFNFDTLKEILLKLAKSHIKLNEDIKAIQNDMSKRDKILIKINEKISKISDKEEKNEDYLKIITNKDDESANNNNNLNEGGINIKLNNNENSIKNMINTEEQNNNIIIDKNEIKTENDNNFSNDINDIIPSKNDDLKINSNEKNSPLKNEKNNININDINKINITKEELMINSNQKSSYLEENKSASKKSLIPDLSKFDSLLKKLNSKIEALEANLSKEEIHSKNFENKFKNNLLNNESKINQMTEKINLLIEKQQVFDKKIENLEIKTSDFDVFSMFKDSGDGNIDMTKVLIKALEEKIFKKFELLDERYKKDANDNIKIKNNVDNIIPKLEQINREIEMLNEIIKQNNDEFNSYKKDNEEKIKNNINEMTEALNKKIKEIKNQIENDIKSKISLLENNIGNLINKSNENNSLDFLKLSLGHNDSDKIDILEKKISDLRAKTNDIENTLKLHINSKDIDLIRNDIKDLKLIIDKKIAKDDLKELYNFHLNVMDEITDIKDREIIAQEDLRKTVKDLQNLQQRVESINGNLSLLQSNPKNENLKIIDFSKYIDNKKLSETLKPIIKEFDKINNELDSLKKEITNIDSKHSTSIKSALNLINEDTDNKLGELKKNLQKKYLDKFEFHKTIKSLEIQIKSTSEDKKKSEADSWLLANKPLNCFNCASCEAKIKNDENIPADYLAWKKYPRGEKIHRMGKGFSHMLQMMTSEFIKNIEKNEFQNENEISSRNININNNNTYLSTNQSNQFIDKNNVNSVLFGKERDDSIGYKKKTKIKLPKMNNSKSKFKQIDGEYLPVSDDENSDKVIAINNNNIKEMEKKRDNSSPKILKITKKTKQNLTEIGKNKNLFKNLVTVQGIFTPREKNNNNAFE